MGIEKFMIGQISPTPDEIEEARKEGGEAAVEALKKKMAEANALLQDKRSDEARDSFNKSQNKKP